MIRSNCEHFQTNFIRFGKHVAELCAICHSNARGPGCFVTDDEVRSRGIDLAVLPGRKDFFHRSREKPTAIAVDPAGIPQELKALPQWVTWRYKWNPKKEKWDKPPLNARTCEPAKSNNPKTWSEFELALTQLKNPDNYLDGIGFVFDAPDPYVGIDRDDCRDPETGQFDEGTVEELVALDSYAEVSPSGTGAKAILRGKLHGGGRNRGDYEVYSQGRYFVITGRKLPEAPATINEGQAAIDAFIANHFPAAPIPPLPSTNHAKRFSIPAPKSRSDLWKKPYDQLTDDDLIALAHEAKNGFKFRALWDGDTSGYENDASRADAALCALLAYWCRRDENRIDSLFRRSKLFRRKWDEKHYSDGRTYGQGTVTNACEVVKSTYPGPQAKKQSSQTQSGQSNNGQSASSDLTSSGYGLIMQFFRAQYEPVFRREQALYSSRLGRLVKSNEATIAPSISLVSQLETAPDAPRNAKGEINRNSIPHFFRIWASVAWRDLLAELPEEEEAAEIDPAATSDFAGAMAAALHQIISLGEVKNDHTIVERRSLIDWAARFAKEGPWKSVRSYCIWSCISPGTGTRIALRVDLMSQLGRRELAPMTQNRFGRLCEQYGIGMATKVAGVRAVELSADYLLQRMGLVPPTVDDSRDVSEAVPGAFGESQ
jgi:putative DNA primase/helicase